MQVARDIQSPAREDNRNISKGARNPFSFFSIWHQPFCKITPNRNSDALVCQTLHVTDHASSASRVASSCRCNSLAVASLEKIPRSVFQSRVDQLHDTSNQRAGRGEAPMAAQAQKQRVRTFMLCWGWQEKRCEKPLLGSGATS